ncbi:MAG: sigma 54-interacting transcriptional regulator [Desulfobacterales bacterium]|nr:MAG: sigma 54-interacting transcriptional regulator [Desulfobacterales bacterium]
MRNESSTNPTSITFEDVCDLAAIVESAHNGIVLVDRSGKILVFNRAALGIVNKRGQDVLGRNIQEVFPKVWADMQQVVETGYPQLARQVTINGNDIIANRTPIWRAGEVSGVLSIFQDISEYEKVLAELESYKQLNEEMDVIINSSYDGLWICDHEGRVVRVNHASEKMSGVKEAEVIGRRMEELVAEGLFDKSATLEVLKNRTAVTLIQRLKDGRHILVTGNPVMDQRGNIRLVVVNARDISELNRLHAELEESRALKEKYHSELNYLHRSQKINSKMVIRSTSMQRVFDTAMRIARVDSSVLITGESGVGKGLIARLIHEASTRAEGSLIHINCGTIPENLIEAELFGYERGAFTGAQQQGKAGYFEMAEGGSLFLDEIGELPLALQVKILHFLETNEVVRIGSTRSRKINARILTATNRNLERMVAEGRFRKDLFFRLKVVPLAIPPLRQRVEDIPPLIHFFLEKYNRKCGCKKTMTSAAVDCLRQYPYPGNVRELANLTEQLVVLTPDERIDIDDLPGAVQRGGQEPYRLTPSGPENLKQIVQDVECQVIVSALKTHGTLRSAARQLGIDHSTLSRKIRRYGITNGAITHQVE